MTDAKSSLNRLEKRLKGLEAEKQVDRMFALKREYAQTNTDVAFEVKATLKGDPAWLLLLFSLVSERSVDDIIETVFHHGFRGFIRFHEKNHTLVEKIENDNFRDLYTSVKKIVGLKEGGDDLSGA